MNNLIFDFDGVLADTWELLLDAHVEIGTESSREETATRLQNYFSKIPHHTRNHSLTDRKFKDLSTEITNVSQIFKREGIKLFTEFVEVVESLENTRKAVVSTGLQSHIAPALAKTIINPTHILGFEDHHSKEEKIELICKDWGVSHDEVYYFTDTLADVYELKNMIAPNKLIGVTWGYCTKEQLLTELTAENLLNSPQDLKLVINR